MPLSCALENSVPYDAYMMQHNYLGGLFLGLSLNDLTIGEVKSDEFCVNLIPETLHRTLIGKRQIGDLVNIEIDPQTQAIVDTVERYLAAKA